MSSRSKDMDIKRDEDVADIHKHVLTVNRTFLEDNLDVKYVMDVLLAKEVISDKQRQTVESHREQFMQVRKLVDILITLPSENFVRFCDACKEGNYKHVHDRLKETLARRLEALGIDGESMLYGVSSGSESGEHLK